MQTPRLPRIPLRLPEQQVRYQHADNVQPDPIFCPAVRPLQRKVLFHPFEQQLDLPAFFVLVRNFRRAAFVVVRHQYQRPAFFARNFNAPQHFVVIVVLLLLAADFFVFAADFPVAEDVFPAHGIFANGFKGRVFLQPRDEMRARRVNLVPSVAVAVALVENVGAACLNAHGLACVQVVDVGVAQAGFHRAFPAVFHLEMQLDATAVVIGARPVIKAAPAQVDDGGIEKVQQGFAFPPQFAVGALHQALREGDEGRDDFLRECVGERAAMNRTGAQVVMAGGMGVEALLQDAQAFAVAEDGKKHGDKQVVTAEFFAVFVGFAGINVMLEGAVHGGLDKGVDAGYCVHGLQLLFFELLYGVLPRETGACNLFLWAPCFIPDSSAQGEGTHWLQK